MTKMMFAPDPTTEMKTVKRWLINYMAREVNLGSITTPKAQFLDADWQIMVHDYLLFGLGYSTGTGVEPTKSAMAYTCALVKMAAGSDGLFDTHPNENTSEMLTETGFIKPGEQEGIEISAMFVPGEFKIPLIGPMGMLGGPHITNHKLPATSRVWSALGGVVFAMSNALIDSKPPKKETKQ